MGRIKIKPKTKRNAAPAPPAATGIPAYAVSRAPLPSPALDALPPQVREQYEALRVVAPKAGGLAVEALENLTREYPQVPQLFNLLQIAYSAAGKRAKADDCIRAAYEAHPAYLFARLNYAELCMRTGELSKIAEIFEGKADLRRLYPERKVFHVAEVVAFCGLLARYFFRVGNVEAAEAQYRALWVAAPKDPTTRRVHRLLHPGPLGRLLRLLR